MPMPRRRPRRPAGQIDPLKVALLVAAVVGVLAATGVLATLLLAGH